MFSCDVGEFCFLSCCLRQSGLSLLKVHLLVQLDMRGIVEAVNTPASHVAACNVSHLYFALCCCLLIVVLQDSTQLFSALTY